MPLAKKENEVKNMMEKLKISREEALELYEFDRLTNKQQKEKLKELGEEEKKEEKKKVSPINKVKQMKKKAVADAYKEELKRAFATWLESQNVKGVQEFKSNQFGFFAPDGSFYSFKLTKHKTVQDGYDIKRGN